MSEELVENQQGTTQKKSGSSFARIVGVIVVIAVIAVAGYFYMNQSSASVAVVNGEKITRAQYDERYIQLAAGITAQGQSATTTEMQDALKSQTIDNLVSETLLLQMASKEGIQADDAAVNNQFSQNKSQFSDNAAFEKILADQGYTDATFKAALTRTNIIQQYLAKHVDVSSVTASAAEVRALYDQAAVGSGSVPPLAEVQTQIENQIKQQKQQQLISDYIRQLRASNTIEILLK